VAGLVCAFGLAAAATGCGADGAPSADSSAKTVKVESIKDRIGKRCNDDTMGVKQADVTIWCDPKESSVKTLVWVDARAHKAADHAKAEAAAKKAAADKARRDAAAHKAKQEAEAKRAAAQKAKARAAAEQAAKQKAAEAKRQEAARQRAAAKAEAERKAAEEQKQQQNTNVYYENCDAVRAAGAAPIPQGDPGYARHLDRDGDGVGCE
jgi:type IV secretory pathway VirB10-like protein